MSKSNSSSHDLISPEIEKPSLFNFSIPHREGSSSTPMCGDGTQTCTVSPLNPAKGGSALPRLDRAPCSPTLVLSEGMSVI